MGSNPAYKKKKKEVTNWCVSLEIKINHNEAGVISFNPNSCIYQKQSRGRERL